MKKSILLAIIFYSLLLVDLFTVESHSIDEVYVLEGMNNSFQEKMHRFKNWVHAKKHKKQKAWARRRRRKIRLLHERVPEYVFEVLKYIESNDGSPPERYIGGRKFGNYRGSLPANTQYIEYDVHPWQPGINRGAERLIRGNNKTAWYTWDHYRTFTKIN